MCQFGFCEGKDTVNAVAHLCEKVNACLEKCVFGYFMDIERLFDNAWWRTLILAEL